MKASCSIPFVCLPYWIDGVPYYDGALSDPIPFMKAFSTGCEKVVLILTKPEDFIRTSGKDRKLAFMIHRKYPKAAERLKLRADRYNRQVELAKEYEAQGRLLIVAPDTLTQDTEAMKQFYQKGLHDGEQIASFVS